MIFADLDLAMRLEKVAAALGHDAVRAHRALFDESSAEAVAFGDGVAVFLDDESPLTQVRGAGASGPIADSEVDEMEKFFEARMAPVTIGLTPFADDALLTHLARRGYEFGAFENTLVRKVGPEDLLDDPDVNVAGDGEEWSRLMAEAFFGEVTAMGVHLGRTLYALPSCRSLIVRGGAEPAAGAQLDIRDGVGVMQCDGTLVRFRGEGLQTKLIRARLSLAASVGCDIVTADTTPGSQSQRNYERLGFRVAYTKTMLLKPCF